MSVTHHLEMHGTLAKAVVTVSYAQYTFARSWKCLLSENTVGTENCRYLDEGSAWGPRKLSLSKRWVL